MAHKSHPTTLRRSTEESNFDISAFQIIYVVLYSRPGLWSNTLLELFSSHNIDVEPSIDFYLVEEPNVQEWEIIGTKVSGRSRW